MDNDTAICAPQASDISSAPVPTVIPDTQHDAVRVAIHGNAALSTPYLVMNALAAVVASYGLLQDSAAVVIGAMIIAMLLGPITGMALALVDGDNPLLRKSLAAECVGAALVLCVGFAIGKVHLDLSLGSQIMSRTAPNILDLIIALAGGAAGAYATVSPRLSVGLVGVAIATALVPPLCACGICLAHGLYAAGGGAFLLFFTNLVAIQCATSLVFWLNGYHQLTHIGRRALLGRFTPSAVLLLALAVFLGYSFNKVVAKEALRSKAEGLLRDRIQKNGAAHLAELRMVTYGPRTNFTAVVRAPWVITPQSCAHLQEMLRTATGRTDVDLQVRSIITRECNAKAYLWEAGDPSGASSGVTSPDSSPGGSDSIVSGRSSNAPPH